MGNIVKNLANEFGRNEQVTRGNLTGLASNGTELMGEQRVGKLHLDTPDKSHGIDTNSAYEELRQGRHVFAKTPDGRQVEIKSLDDLKSLNLNDPTAGMGGRARRDNTYAGFYNSFTPGWWPKQGAEKVSWDGSHLESAGYAPFAPPPPMYARAF